MNKDSSRFIIILLFMIIVLACILMLRIHNSNNYNETLYNNIYNEYNDYFINEEEINTEDIDLNILEQHTNNLTNENNSDSNVIGKIVIPSIQIDYPILRCTTDELLKIAPTKLCGPDINEKGNLCIIGHNYHNSNFFSKLNQINIGDNVVLTNADNKSELTYVANKIYVISKNDLSVLNQQNDKEIELTLITCTNNKNERLIVKCNAVL